MAKIQLTNPTPQFKKINEGVHTFKVVEVDDSKFDKFGKIAVKLENTEGENHTEYFSLMKANGEINDGALKAWSYFSRVCLNNFETVEVDTQDVVGCSFIATARHEKYTITKGDHAGKEGTRVKLTDYKPIAKTFVDGFMDF